MSELRTRGADLRLPALYLLAGTALVTGYYSLGRPFGVAVWVPHVFLTVSVGFSAAVALLAGIRLHRPAYRAAWLWIAVGQIVYFSADALFFTYHEILHDARYPAPSEVLYLGNKVLLAFGLFLLARQRRRDRGPLVDTLIVGSAAGLLIWIFLMGPYATGGHMDLLVRLTSIAFPVMDLIVLLFAVRLFVNGVRTWSMYLLATSLSCMLFADFVYGWMQIHGSYATANYVNAAWMASSLLLGAAALHKSMARSAAAAGSTSTDLKTSRLLLLASASLVAPATLLVERVRGESIDAYPIAAASIILFMLVVARLAQAGRLQKLALDRLELAETDKARLLARVVEVAERERSSFAADLHDGPMQRMTVIGLTIDTLARRVGSDRLEGLENSLAKVRQDVSGEMSSLRRTMAELRPPMLDERGIGAALNDLAQTVFGGTSLTWTVRNAIGSVRLVPEVETVVYRVAGELLVNARKHADATRVELALERRGETLCLVVAHDANGVVQPVPGHDSTDSHVGLLGIEERVASVGGTWSIHSAPGFGTRCEALLPWKPRAPEPRAKANGYDLVRVVAS